MQLIARLMIVAISITSLVILVGLQVIHVELYMKNIPIIQHTFGKIERLFTLPEKADPMYPIIEGLYAELGPSIVELGKVEQQLLKNTELSNVSHGASRTLDATSRDYLQQMQKLQTTKTVFYSVARSTFLSILNNTVYSVRSNDCGKLVHKAIISKDVYGIKCLEIQTVHDNLFSTLRNKPFDMIGNYSFQLGQFSDGNMSNNSTNEMDIVQLGYVHIIKNGIIMRNGDVQAGATYISIIRCSRKLHDRFNRNTVPRYNKVFSISQYWGEGYYHFINEDLPRIVLSIPFLLQNKDILIHVKSQNTFTKLLLEDLGISKTRLVSGIVRAQVAYIPGGSTCGMASIIPVNVLSMVLQNTLVNKHSRDTIVLIKRSSKRWFGKHKEILEMLGSIAQNFSLRLEVFRDNPVPSLNVTKHLFNRAVMVVGPHGAGLSNIIFSQPGTCIVEGLCYGSSNRLNHCYKHLAQILGHIYYGIVPIKQCMQIGTKDLVLPVKQCLQWLHGLNKLKL